MDADLQTLADGFDEVFQGDHRPPQMDIELRRLPQSFEDVFRDEHGIKKFPLFQLPTELWLRVCELAVTFDRPINVTKSALVEQQVASVYQPAITRTCKLLRRETLPLFYRNNIFEARHFCEHACPRRWMVTIGLVNLRMMRTFRLHTRMSDTFWEGCFDRAGVKTTVEVTNANAKGT
ncbi:hypothetical protein LTR53_018552, partial [Teratosphaeriaceae sp. CCFEE 6253]